MDKSRIAWAVVRSSGFLSKREEHTFCKRLFSCATASMDSGRQYGLKGRYFHLM